VVVWLLVSNYWLVLVLSPTNFATVWNQASIPNPALYQGIRAIDIRRNARTWWYDLQSLAATVAAAVLLMAAGEAAGTPWLADVV